MRMARSRRSLNMLKIKSKLLGTDRFYPEFPGEKPGLNKVAVLYVYIRMATFFVAIYPNELFQLSFFFKGIIILPKQEFGFSDP